MAKQIINLGSGVGTHDGDGARTGGEKINDNFTEVYDTIDLLIADSTMYNKVLVSTGFSLAGQDLTINAAWQWIIGNVAKTNPSPVVINIPFATTGKSRIEYVVPNDANSFTRIIGVESTTIPLAPAIPNKDMFVTWYVVDDGSISEMAAPIIGENYISKNEKTRLDNINGTGSIADWTIGNERSCFNFSNAVTEFKSFHYITEMFVYDGKIFTFKNSQAGAVTLFHNAGTGLFKFRFPNASNFVLHQNEVVEFRLNYEDSSVPKLEYIGIIASTSFSGTQDDVPDGITYKQYSVTEKSKLADTYTKGEVDSKVASVYVFKGNVANYASLPSTGLTAGDVYNLADTGANYAWTGTVWDELGTTVDISGKVDKNTAITGATKTKITYDAKGLVTSGADATTADIAASTNKNYVTDAQQTALHPQETATTIATINHGATAKTVLIDADEVTGQNSATSFSLIRTVWSDVWTYIKSKADSIYQATLVSGTNIKTINSTSLLGSGNISVIGTLPINVTNITTSSYTLDITHANILTKIIGSFNATITLPNNATVNYPVGTVIELVSFAGNINALTLGSGVTMSGNSSSGINSIVHIIQISINIWVMTSLDKNAPAFTGIGTTAGGFYTIGSNGRYAFQDSLSGMYDVGSGIVGFRSYGPGNTFQFNPIYTSQASGTFNTIYQNYNISPTSGTQIGNMIGLYPTVNQTGGASGIVRSLYIDPTLTSAFDFRAIDIVKGSIVLPYLSKTATYSITNNDYLIDCTSGTFTTTLPTAVGQTGKIFKIKNSGSGAITIATTSSQTIDGSTTYSLAIQYKYVEVTSNGANWIITSNN